MAYRVLLRKQAAKYYQGLDDKTTGRINSAIDSISANPLEGRHIKKLRGTLAGKYRYAVGDLRIVYTVSEGEALVVVEAIGPRGGIYK